MGTRPTRSRSTDRFVRFVDELTANLDDDLPAADRAARCHLSRHHFDRVFRSLAGEPPETFRRRILLERAAFQMTTTQRSLLDIAFSAGYGSHEAFTRAFTRAYGTTPSSWRGQPGPLTIAAPSGVHFHPPGSIRLPSRKTVTPMDLLTKMVEHHVWLTSQMIELADRLDETQLDEPIELNVDDDVQTIRSLLSRLVGQMGMWNAAIDHRPYDFAVEDHESLTSLTRRLGVEGPSYLNQVTEVVATNRLDDTFVDAMCEPAEVFTYGGMIAHVLTFAAHRRTLVALALAKHGLEDLGWGDPMRWVADPR